MLGVLAAFGFAFLLSPESFEAGAQLINTLDQPESLAMATNGEQSIRALIRRVVNWALFFLGLVAVIVIIYGGYKTVTAGATGNDADKSAGINAIVYAVIGIVIILLSYAIVNTVLTVGSGIEPNA